MRFSQIADNRLYESEPHNYPYDLFSCYSHKAIHCLSYQWLVGASHLRPRVKHGISCLNTLIFAFSLS